MMPFKRIQVVGVVMLVLPFCAMTKEISPLSAQIAAGMVAGEDDEQLEGYYRLGMGFDFSDIWSAGLAASYVGGEHAELALEPYVRAGYTLDGGASLYTEAGVRLAGELMTVGVGLLQPLTPTWKLNVGYHWYQEPNNARQGDGYTLALGLEYRPVLNVESVIPTTIEPIPSAPLTPSPSPTSHSCKYRVVEGDYLYRIARQYHTDLNGLVQLNPWLTVRQARKWGIFPDETVIVPCTINDSIKVIE